MSTDVGIGFNMNPRWVGPDGLEAFLTPLCRAGLTRLEFELDRYLPEWEQVQPLMEASASLGLKFSFHAPYRGPSQIAGFSSGQRDPVIALFRPMLSIAQQWSERLSEPVNVVTHGARSTTAGQAALREDTLAFLRWALDEFPGIRLALENNHPAKPGEIKIGETRLAVLEMVNELDHPRLGICWDLGHDFLSRDASAVTDAWLNRVVHVHIHDVDEQGVDHYPLIYGNIPYSTWLPLLRSADALRVVTLELKGGLMMGWHWDRIQTALITSLTTIRQGLC